MQITGPAGPYELASLWCSVCGIPASVSFTEDFWSCQSLGTFLESGDLKLPVPVFTWPGASSDGSAAFSGVMELQ